MAEQDKGYINYFEILGVPDDCKTGEVRKNYKQKTKSLLVEISKHQQQMTRERRDTFLLDLARLNAAFFILRDKDRRQRYQEDRERVMRLEEEWRAAVARDPENIERATDQLRRSYDAALRHFLSTYLEDRLLEAGRDPECVEASNWNRQYERHATSVLRHYRQRLYQEIHERLPYYEVSRPEIDWDERRRRVEELVRETV